MKYRKFIEVLRPYIDESRTLIDKPKLHEDVQFRNWRHRLTDLLKRISSEGFDINCNVSVRAFDRRGTYGYSPSKSERLTAYNQDIQDTILELETIVSHYAALGEPKRNLPELKYPSRMTPGWIWANASASLWWSFMGLLVTAFLLGVGVARSPLYIQLEKLFHLSA